MTTVPPNTTIVSSTKTLSGQSSAGGTSSLADTSRFAGLIDVYTTLATSDPVMRVLERRGLIDPAELANGKNPISAIPVVSTIGGAPTISMPGPEILLGPLTKRFAKQMGKAKKLGGQLAHLLDRKALGASRYLNQMADKVFENVPIDMTLLS